MSGYPPQEPPPGYTPSAYPPQGQQPMSYPQYNPGPPYPQHMQAQSASTVTVVTQPATVLCPGVCHYCGVGFPRAEFTILGIVIAFLFFPLGIICCMMMTENRCTNCHRQL